MKTILLFILLLSMGAIDALAQPAAAPGAQPNSADLMEIPAPDPTADPAPDPTEDPSGYANAVKDAFGAGKFFGIILLLWGVGRVLASQKARTLVKALEGKMARAVVTGLIGITGAAAISLGATGAIDWQALIGAVLAAVAVYMTPPEPKPSPAVPP